MADTEAELVQICLGTTVLKHCAMLGLLALLFMLMDHSSCI